MTLKNEIIASWLVCNSARKHRKDDEQKEEVAKQEEQEQHADDITMLHKEPHSVDQGNKHHRHCGLLFFFF